jgi:hypothetical protein
MKLDVRSPIGAMFTAYGLLLTGFGLFADQTVALKKSGMNANLVWGLTMLAFGAVMLGLVFRTRTGERAVKKP